MGIRSNTRTGVSELSRTGFCCGQEFGDRFTRRFVGDCQNRREMDSERDRLQILSGIERQLFVDVRIDDE